MKTHAPVVAVIALLPVIPPAAETATSVTETCTDPGVNACSPEPPAPSHALEHGAEHAIVERTRAEQAPPEQMPAGRGLTWAMQQEVYEQPHSWVRGGPIV
jgi:hypothetical protein